MSKRRPSGKQSKTPPEAPKPVDVVDGIPDRAAHPGARHYAVLVAAFVAWVAFLLYCQMAGTPG